MTAGNVAQVSDIYYSVHRGGKVRNEDIPILNTPFNGASTDTPYVYIRTHEPLFHWKWSKGSKL